MGFKAEQRGDLVVIRDEDGNVVHRYYGRSTDTKKTLREYVKQVTNNCFEQVDRLVSISRGEAHIAKLPDGRESEPVVPTIEAQRQAAKDLIELTHGKAVAQTEVVKAEAEAQLAEQVRALSDEELEARVRAALSAKANQKELPSSVDSPPAEPD